jgi:hypothetical protein
VQGRHAAIVAVEKGQKIFGQVVLIARRQGADDAEVHGRIARIFRVVHLYEDIARMHVGMEEIVAKHLREEYLHAVLRKPADIRTARPQLLEIVDDDAVNALHDHDVDAAVVPVDLGHVEQRGARKVALQLRGVAGLAQQVQLIENGLAVFFHQLHRPQPARFPPVLVGKLGQVLQYFQVEIDDLAHPRTQYLDDDLAAAQQRGDVHLGNGSGGERHRIETREHARKRRAEGIFNGRNGNRAVERRDAILKLRQLIGDVGGQQVAAGRQGLPELDEDRPQLLERQTQPFAAGGAYAALKPGPGRKIDEKAKRPV